MKVRQTSSYFGDDRISDYQINLLLDQHSVLAVLITIIREMQTMVA